MDAHRHAAASGAQPPHTLSHIIPLPVYPEPWIQNPES